SRIAWAYSRSAFSCSAFTSSMISWMRSSDSMSVLPWSIHFDADIEQRHDQLDAHLDRQVSEVDGRQVATWVEHARLEGSDDARLETNVIHHLAHQVVGLVHALVLSAHQVADLAEHVARDAEHGALRPDDARGEPVHQLGLGCGGHRCTTWTLPHTPDTRL